MTEINVNAPIEDTVSVSTHVNDVSSVAKNVSFGADEVAEIMEVRENDNGIEEIPIEDAIPTLADFSMSIQETGPDSPEFEVDLKSTLAKMDVSEYLIVLECNTLDIQKQPDGYFYCPEAPICDYKSESRNHMERHHRRKVGLKLFSENAHFLGIYFQTYESTLMKSHFNVKYAKQSLMINIIVWIIFESMTIDSN